MLTDKNILMFAPAVFGYEKEIKKALINSGAYVDYYDERPKNNFIVKASIRINKKIVQKQIIKYYSAIFNKTIDKKYDYVFVVNLEAMTPPLIKKLRQQQSNAIFILYMWDSIQNKKTALEAFPHFDWGYSFDKNDSQMIKGINFRPLFFIDKFDSNKSQQAVTPNIDLCFMGTVHSDRYNLIQNIKKQAGKIGLTTYFFMYFQSPILFWYKKLTDLRFYKALYNEFSFNALNLDEIVKKIFQSKVILDIQHPNQTGLTMRTIEMIGAEKKIITTNAAIKEYDFYNPKNILVIDRENPVIDKSFFIEPYISIAPTIKEKYSIKGWIKEIFKLQNEKISLTNKPAIKITIITVVLNNKKFIADAINSVLKQKYSNIEYIVIDGGSTDGSLEIIQQYTNKITKIISEKDKGIYDAMNKGLSIATGDVIGFLNSDDFYANENVLSKIALKFEHNIDAVYADLDYVSTHNKNKIIRAWRSGKYHDNKFYYGWMPPHPTFFVRKNIYQNFGGYNTFLQSSADYELMLRFILKHKISLQYIPEVLVKMRVGGQSNRNFTNRIKANLEDRKAWSVNNLEPNFFTFLLKPLQKIFQYRF